MSATHFTLRISALADPISRQLPGLLSERDAEVLDRDMDALNRCVVHGLLADTEADRARHRLLKKVKQAIARHCTEQEAVSFS